MIPWEKIDQAAIPGSNDILSLQQRGEEFSIRISGTELMNSRQHGSEEDLATLAIAQIKKHHSIRILIGGLGMGFTLASSLKASPPDTRITVSELIPAIVEWNKTHLGHLAGSPLDDPRVSVEIQDVAEVIQKTPMAWDVILLDVDNGPEGLTQKSNNRLYTEAGLKKAYSSLASKGVLAVWSCGSSPEFTKRLKQCGFIVQTIQTRARKSKKGAVHVIWLAKKK